MKKKREVWERNRNLSQRPKKYKGWCDGCDRAVVEQGQKCPCCGYVDKPARFKRYYS